MASAEIWTWQTWWLSLQHGYQTIPGSWTTMTAQSPQVDEEGVADPRRTAGPSSSNQGDSSWM
eukprot:1253425-Prorocentrum_lima.AAC.1